MTKKFSDKQRIEIVEGYKNGTSLEELGTKFGCASGTIGKLLIEALGLETYKKIGKDTTRKFSKKQQLEIIEKFKSGIFIEKLALKFGCSGTPIKNVLIKGLGLENYKKIGIKHYTEHLTKNPLLEKSVLPKKNSIETLRKFAKLLDKNGIIELRMRLQKKDANPRLTYQLSILSRDIEIMKWLVAKFDGHFFLKYTDTQFFYTWYVNRKNGKKLLRDVYQFLTEKKSQAKIYLESLDRDEKFIVNSNGKEFTSEVWAQKMLDWEQIIKLNIPRRNNKLQQDFTSFIAQIKKFFIQPLSDQDLGGGQFDPKLFSENDWERIILQLYYDMNLNSTEVANYLGCGQTTLRRPMIRLGILKK